MECEHRALGKADERQMAFRQAPLGKRPVEKRIEHRCGRAHPSPHAAAAQSAMSNDTLPDASSRRRNGDSAATNSALGRVGTHVSAWLMMDWPSASGP
jgi:hypothetical protein